MARDLLDVAHEIALMMPADTATTSTSPAQREASPPGTATSTSPAQRGWAAERTDAPRGSAAGEGAAPRAPPLRFADVLEALNPLQYLPVVGTIYRAVTGDTIPEWLRLGGSFLISGLLSGPIGIVTTAAITIAEKVSGIDPDRIGRTLLADIGVGKPVQAAAAPKAAGQGPAVTPTPVPPAATPPAAGWTVADLSREGVTFGVGDTPSWHGVGGAEALNEVELARLGDTAVAAYARTAAQAS